MITGLQTIRTNVSRFIMPIIGHSEPFIVGRLHTLLFNQELLTRQEGGGFAYTKRSLRELRGMQWGATTTALLTTAILFKADLFNYSPLWALCLSSCILISYILGAVLLAWGFKCCYPPGNPKSI